MFADINRMNSRRRRRAASITLRNAVIISSVVSTLFNCIILLISAPSGRWVLGDALCQMTALISQTLVSGSVWLIALSALERCYQYLLPGDHASVFSEINTRILTSGVYLFLVVFHTGPLYGWGEYSSHRGGLYLSVNMMPAFNVSMKDNDALLITNAVNQSCLTTEAWTAKLSFTPHNITQAMVVFLEGEYKVKTRIEMTSLLLIILRFDLKASVMTFVEELSNGDMTRKMADYMIPLFSSCCNNTVPDTLFAFHLTQESYRHYIDVHIPFQELGVCSLDFSPVNGSIRSWIPFVVSTSVGLPYGITFICGAILYRKSLTYKHRGRIHGAEAFLVGSIVGAAMSVPYYYVNVANHRETYVNYIFNLVATILFYLNSIAYFCTYICVLCCTQTVTSTVRSSGVSRSTEISIATDEVSTPEVLYPRSGRFLKLIELSHSV